MSTTAVLAYDHVDGDMRIALTIGYRFLVLVAAFGLPSRGLF